MPIMDGRGRVLAGQAGMQGSLDGVPLPFASYGGGCWMDDAGTALESVPNPPPATLAVWNTLTGDLQLLARGANDWAGGGGAGIAWLAGFGVWGTLEQRLPGTPDQVRALLAGAGTCGPHAVAPDGTIAYVPDRMNGYGIRLVAADGTIEDVPGILPLDVQVLGRGVAIWRGGAHGRAVPRPAVPAIELLLQSFNGHDWLLGWNDSVGCFLQIDGETDGCVLDTRPLEFNRTMRVVGDELHIAWSTTQGEGPTDLVVCALAADGTVRYLHEAANVRPQRPTWRDLTTAPPIDRPPIDPPPIDPPPIDRPPIDPPPIDKPPIDKPPIEPPPVDKPPIPEGTLMLTVDLTSPLIRGVTGEKHPNDDGTISVKCPDGWLSVDSTGTVKFAPEIGSDERFTFSGTALVATNTYDGVKVWMIPCVETP